MNDRALVTMGGVSGVSYCGLINNAGSDIRRPV